MSAASARPELAAYAESTRMGTAELMTAARSRRPGSKDSTRSLVIAHRSDCCATANLTTPEAQSSPPPAYSQRAGHLPCRSIRESARCGSPLHD